MDHHANQTPAANQIPAANQTPAAPPPPTANQTPAASAPADQTPAARPRSAAPEAEETRMPEARRETATDAVEPEQEKAPETAETVPEEAKEADAPQDDGVLTVTVREDKILYKGEEVTLVQLEEDLLKDYKVGEVDVELRDDHAIKAAYDEVKGLLDRLHIPFTVGK